MGCDTTCIKCNYFTGTPNTKKGKHMVFICSDCKSGYDNSENIAERKFESALFERGS